MEQLSPQIRSIINHDLLLRCQAVSDELLDMAYVWTHNNMPLLNSNSEVIGHIVSIRIHFIRNFLSNKMLHLLFLCLYFTLKMYVIFKSFLLIK